VIQIFLPGGLSHVDSMDYKPELDRSHGKSLQGEKPEAFFNAVGLLHKSHFPFKQYGQSGQWISSMFPRLGEVVDELTFIRSMVAESGNHVPAIYQANCGLRAGKFIRQLADVRRHAGSARDLHGGSKLLGERIPPGRTPRREPSSERSDRERSSERHAGGRSNGSCTARPPRANEPSASSVAPRKS
jgi:hypothetical protein